MTRPQRRSGLLFAALVAASCSKPAPAPPPSPTPTATPVAATPVPTPAGVLIRTLELGRAIGPDNRVTQADTVFRPADTIYVAVLTEGAGASANIKARFVYGADSQLVSESSQTIAPTGPAATEFHIAKPDGWPAGAYAVEVSLDGGAPRRAEFKVE